LLIAISIGLFVSFLTIAIYIISPSFLREIDLRLSDYRFRYRGVETPNQDVVILAIDEKSINKIGRWVWSRGKIADIVDKLTEYEPSVVAFDVVFSEPETASIDSNFSKALSNNGNVVLGYFFRDESTESVNQEDLDIHRNSRVKLIKYTADTGVGFIRDFKSVELNIGTIAKGARGFGFFNIFPESDGVYRKSQLILRYKNDIFPSLHLEALRLFKRSNIFLTIADFGVDSLYLNKYRIPINEKGSFLLDFYGPSGTFPTYSIADLLDGTLPVEALKGKIVFIGATEIGISDIRATPFDPASPGVEIQATAAANMLDGRFLVKNSFTDFINLSLIVAFTMVFVILLSFFRSTIAGLLLLFGFLALHIISNYVLFNNYSLVLNMLYPMLSMGLTYVGYEGYRNLLVEKRSRFLKRAFSSYVSPDLVTQIMDDPDRLKLGGERKEVSILFSDIRGFTTLSESTTPETLVTLLNEYLNPMTDIVMKEQGTLDKYIGDAVMAIFGAPVDLPDHAKRSCSAAVLMMEKLNEINGQWKEKGFPNIDIGIGINTGDAIVGNMGANIRFDYTAIGDNVNLASRLEGLNKFYGTHIIISETTKDELDENSFITREVDLVRVKGKNKPISIYQVMTDSNSGVDMKKIAEMFTDALEKYRNREFGAAKRMFSEILGIYPGDDVSRLYIERCEDYMVEPPPEDWDKVYTAKSK